MRENEPVLLVLSTYDGKLFLRKVKFYLRNVTRNSYFLFLYVIIVGHTSIVTR